MRFAGVIRVAAGRPIVVTVFVNFAKRTLRDGVARGISPYFTRVLPKSPGCQRTTRRGGKQRKIRKLTCGSFDVDAARTRARNPERRHWRGREPVRDWCPWPAVPRCVACAPPTTTTTPPPLLQCDRPFVPPDCDFPPPVSDFPSSHPRSRAAGDEPYVRTSRTSTGKYAALWWRRK